MTADAARRQLRDATGAVHQRLHGVPVFARLAEGGITRQDYVALLARLLGFHRGVEAALAAAPPLAAYGIDLAARRRSGLLLADLAALGAAAEGTVAPIAPPGSAAAALGWLYVTEGSTLGGQHLARGLDALLPAGGAGRHFLLGYGPRHAAMWRGCCAAIEACGADPDRLTAMVGGASAAFDAFEAWFAGDPAVQG
jgi:heme oxygenase